jgi:hypothetical protein
VGDGSETIPKRWTVGGDLSTCAPSPTTGERRCDRLTNDTCAVGGQMDESAREALPIFGFCEEKFAPICPLRLSPDLCRRVRTYPGGQFLRMVTIRSSGFRCTTPSSSCLEESQFGTFRYTTAKSNTAGGGRTTAALWKRVSDQLECLLTCSSGGDSLSLESAPVRNVLHRSSIVRLLFARTYLGRLSTRDEAAFCPLSLAQTLRVKRYYVLS